LTDGSRKLDPTGAVTDYEQYDLFVTLLKRWLMATAPFGNHNMPPKWIPPWNPEAAAKSLGIWHILKEDQIEPEEIPQGNGDGSG
jgi:hypothetical protein